MHFPFRRNWQSQLGGAKALRSTLTAFPDEAVLRAHEMQIGTPLIKFFGKKDFSGRLECVEDLEVLAARVGGFSDANVREGAAEVSLAAMRATASEHDWPMRKAGIALARRLLSAEEG